MKSNIVLIGPRCVGKTGTAVHLADILKADFKDSDALIECRFGRISDIVDSFGWKYFRKLETNIISEMAKAYHMSDVVFAAGGGSVVHEYAVYRDENLRILKSFGHIILLMPSESLEESARIISERMVRDDKSAGQRPSLTGNPIEKEMLDMLRNRIGLYNEARDSVFYTRELNEEQAARSIIEKLNL